MTNPSIAATILAQLGGNRFIVMTGARNLLNDGQGLRFMLPRTRTKWGDINRVWIHLNASDTYIIETGRWNKKDMTVKRVCREENVHADQIRAIFTTMTGLETSL
jgi:hypothetical protein